MPLILLPNRPYSGRAFHRGCEYNQWSKKVCLFNWWYAYQYSYCDTNYDCNHKLLIERNRYEARLTSKEQANMTRSSMLEGPQTLFCVHKLCVSYVIKICLLINVLRSVLGQGQKREQKHITNVVEFHTPLLTMLPYSTVQVHSGQRKRLLTKVLKIYQLLIVSRGN